MNPASSNQETLQGYVPVYSSAPAHDKVTVPKSISQALIQLSKGHAEWLNSPDNGLKVARAKAAKARVAAELAVATVKGVEERLASSESTPLPATTSCEKKGSARTPCKTSVEGPVHRTWYTVLGLPYASKNQKDIRLPDPRVDGTVKPLTPDGSWSVNWALGPTVGHNPEVCNHVRSLLDQNKGKDWAALTDDKKESAVNGYFVTMSGKWRTYGNVERQAQDERRRQAHALNMCRECWVNGLLKALPALIEYITKTYGAEYIPGLADILGQHRWYGLPCDGKGAASQEDWDAHKVKCGGGSAITAWEVREYAWKSPKVCRYLYTEMIGGSPILQLICLQVLLMKKAREMSVNVKQTSGRNFQFPGLPVNIIQDAPGGAFRITSVLRRHGSKPHNHL
ncbi:unnamed protein product [Peniophora sp. CBMAI 1063]|nr:unnamed protein product [Peniophora sp. CBMAI 1063]